MTEHIDEGLKEVARELVAELVSLRDDWDSDIPEVIAHSADIKVRKAWFQNVFLTLSEVLSNKLVLSNTEQEVEQFFEDYSGRNFTRLTTKEDIERGDAIINMVIDDIKSLLGE